MRVSIPAVVASLFFWSALCSAEPAVTLRQFDLKQQPAADAKAVATVTSGTVVDVVKREGAWVQLKAGSDTGWTKLFDVRMGTGATTAAPAPKSSGISGIAQTLNLATGKRDSSVTTGVRGLDEQMLKKAQPNPQEGANLDGYASTPDQAQAFAKAGKLTPRTVALLKAEEPPKGAPAK
jgi:hypothetical protein